MGNFLNNGGSFPLIQLNVNGWFTQEEKQKHQSLAFGSLSYWQRFWTLPIRTRFPSGRTLTFKPTFLSKPSSKKEYMLIMSPSSLMGTHLCVLVPLNAAPKNICGTIPAVFLHLISSLCNLHLCNLKLQRGRNMPHSSILAFQKHHSARNKCQIRPRLRCYNGFHMWARSSSGGREWSGSGVEPRRETQPSKCDASAGPVYRSSGPLRGGTS